MSTDPEQVNGSCCACLRVLYKPVRNQNGSLTERWCCELSDDHQFVRRAEVERLRAENAKLRETISHFVKKYDECDPYIASAFFLAYTNRGGQYTGPTFKDELGALRALANGGAETKEGPDDLHR